MHAIADGSENCHRANNEEQRSRSEPFYKGRTSVLIESLLQVMSDCLDSIFDPQRRTNNRADQ